MPDYYLLCNFTKQGIETIKDSTDRIAKAKKLFTENGGKVKSMHVVLGRFDTIVLVEALNDEMAAKLSLKISMLGNVRIETLRAFTETEFSTIVKEVV